MFSHHPIQEITKDRLWDHYQNWISQRQSKRTGKPAKQQILKALRYLKAELNYAIHIKDYITTNPCDIFRGRVSLQSDNATQHLTIRESQELWDHYQNWISQRQSKRTGKPAKQQILKALRYLKAELNYSFSFLAFF